jgi:hypothetical protein
MPACKDIITEAEEYTLLGAITEQRLVKTQKTLCELQYSDFYIV